MKGVNLVHCDCLVPSRSPTTPEINLFKDRVTRSFPLYPTTLTLSEGKFVDYLLKILFSNMTIVVTEEIKLSHVLSTCG